MTELPILPVGLATPTTSCHVPTRWGGIVVFYLGVLSAGCSGVPESPVKSIQPRPPTRAGPREPRIWLDGKRIRPRVVWLSGNPLDTSLGGTVKINGTPLYVEAGQQLRLIQAGPKRCCLYRLGPNGTRPLVGVKITAECPGLEDKRCVVHNPLVRLSRAQIRRLRSVTLEYWNDEILQQLRRTDTRRLCIYVNASIHLENPWVFPRLPGIPCLQIGYSISPGFGDYSALTWQRELRYFSVGSWLRNKLPLHRLRHLTRLRVLDLSRLDMGASFDFLAKLTQLRVVDVSGLKLKDVRFVRHLRHLRNLNTHGSDVEDLTPLGGHPTLERCDASSTLVSKLPGSRIPRLRELSLLSTSVSRSVLARFRKRHPGAIVWHSWRQRWLHAIAGVTRLRIVRETEDSIKVIVDERNRERIRRFIRRLRFEETTVGRCCGEALLLQFYRGSRLLVGLQVGDYKSMRWRGWPADAELKADSSKMLRTLVQQGRLAE